MEERKRDKENEEKITYVDRDMLVVWCNFFTYEEEKYREKQLYSAVNSKVSQSPGKNIYFFLNEGARFGNF